MSEPDWFDVHEGPQLHQGDVIINCPRFNIAGLDAWPIVNTSVTVEEERITAVIMSQSCDLENNKIEQVLLAQVLAWEDLYRAEVARGNMMVKSRNFRKALIEGTVTAFSLLHKFDGAVSFPWSLVDFRRLFVLPKAVLQHVLSSHGPRLRLRSPYREHLAQAFARFFMRVGLPHNAHAFETEGALD